ncbi:MAG: hypothetical protein HC771_13830 [Synechococcales cyanobacterium CRU_2_2]|nr:hypothetical protein [Synechococcales cyanobacterium CRU_2_2]
MNPSFLRQFWTLVEDAQATTLLQLDDMSLSAWLIGRVEQELMLDGNEQIFATHYIQSRLPLVRDLAQARLGDF